MNFKSFFSILSGFVFFFSHNLLCVDSKNAQAGSSTASSGSAVTTQTQKTDSNQRRGQGFAPSRAPIRGPREAMGGHRGGLVAPKTGPVVKRQMQSSQRRASVVKPAQARVGNTSKDSKSQEANQQSQTTPASQQTGGASNVSTQTNQSQTSTVQTSAATSVTTENNSTQTAAGTEQTSGADNSALEMPLNATTEETGNGVEPQK